LPNKFTSLFCFFVLFLGHPRLHVDLEGRGAIRMLRVLRLWATGQC